MKVNRAIFQSRFAYLSEDFGEELAMKKFNLTEDQLLQIVGIYVKGQRRGLLRGKIIWTKCTKGGWVKTGPYDWETGRACGYVCPPGKCSDFQLVDSWTGEPYHWTRSELVDM